MRARFVMSEGRRCRTIQFGPRLPRAPKCTIPAPMTTAAPYLSFGDGKPFALRMGLQPLPPEQWIEIDAAYTAQLATKRDLLATRHADVLQALPQSRPASEEALTLLLDHLHTYHSDRFAFDGGKLRNGATGATPRANSSTRILTSSSSAPANPA